MQVTSDLAAGLALIRRSPLVYFLLSLLFPASLAAVLLGFGLTPGRHPITLHTAGGFLTILLSLWAFIYFTMMAAVRQIANDDGSARGFLRLRAGPLFGLPLAVVFTVGLSLIAMIPVFLVQWLIVSEGRDMVLRGAMLGGQGDPAYFVSFAFVYSLSTALVSTAIGSYFFAGFVVAPILSGLRGSGTWRAIREGREVAAAVRSRIFHVLFAPIAVTQTVVIVAEALWPIAAIMLGLMYVQVLTMAMLPLAATVAIVGEHLSRTAAPGEVPEPPE